MKKTNKLISILLVLAMLLSMAPLSLTASAAGTPSYSTTSEGVRLYANGTNLFIEAGTASGTAVYYMNGSTKTYVNPNGAKGNDLSNSEIYMGTASSNDDYLDVSLVMTGGEVGTIYTAKSYGYLIGNVTVAVTGTAKAGLIWCGSKYGPDSGQDLHGKNGNLAIFNTVGAEIRSGSTGFDGMIKYSESGWEISGNAVIPEGATMTVAAGQTVTVPADAAVENNGALVNNGTLELYGAVTGNNITGNGKINCHTAYIENISSVSSISAKINGESVELLNGQYRILDGNLYIWLPDGNAQVTLNSVKYYGVVARGERVALTAAYTAPNDISGIPSEIIAYVSEPLSPKTNSTTFDVDFTYEVLTSGTTAADAKMTGTSLYASGAGTIKLKITASDAYTSYSETFTVTVNDAGYAASVANGNIVISKYSDTQIKVTHAGFDGGYIIIGNDDVLLITGTSDAEKDYGITVESGTAKVIFKDVSITRANDCDKPPVRMVSGATLYLSLAGTNVLTDGRNTSGGSSTSDGETNAGLHVPEGATLIIDGEGALDVNGGNTSAGIGGGKSVACGNITINGGTVTATGGSNGAGIGGGCYAAGGNITINGGTVTATGGRKGAGIGGGDSGADGGNITINGGTVSAKGGSLSAGIGGGCYGAGGTITVNGGTVTATGDGGAGIGGGYKGAGATVTISGGTVTATGIDGAGIGGGGCAYASQGAAGDGGTVTISGGTVTATGTYGAGIGGGGVDDLIPEYNATAGAGGTVTISGGTVVAQSTGSYGGAGIGSGGSRYGTGNSGGTVVITGGNIKATSNGGEAIGKGFNGTDSGTLKNADGNDLTLNTITLGGAAADTAVTKVEGINYGLTDVKTLDTDKIYFYLPADTAATSITAGGNEYICNGNLTYYTAHSWANNDGICANGCGTECDHAGQSGESCEICGAVLHTHSFTYSAGLNGSIVATCVADGCPLENGIGGMLTISAPADLYVDGTAKEATIENNLVDTSVAISDITYSAPYGLPPKDAGTYTASVTVGGATATVEFTLLNYAAKVTDKDGNELSDSPYKTFADAITAAQGSEGSTLTLLDDVTLSSVQYVYSGTFTLDLNGKTLLNETAEAINIESDVDVTIKDSGEGGTIESKEQGYYAVYNYGTLTVEDGFFKGDAGIRNVGTLNFKNGKIEAGTYSAISGTGTAYIYDGTFESSEQGAITVNTGGTAYIYGGEFSGSCGITNHGTAYIEGGEFKGNSFAAINLLSGTVEVTGGSFTGTDDEYGDYSGTPFGEYTVCYNEDATLVLKGGEFPNGFVVAYTTANTFLAEGYAFYDKDGNKISVADDAKIIDGYVQVKEHFVASVTDKDGNAVGTYKTLADAITAAQGSEDSTVTLLDDITLTEEQYVYSGKFTLELNGKKIISENYNTLYIWENADLTINDSGEGGTVQTNGATSQTIFNCGTLTIENGLFKGAAGIVTSGTLNFKNGKIEADTYDAIRNSGTVYIYNGSFTSIDAGAINVDTDGTAYIYGGEFSGFSGISNSGTAYIEGGEFKGNSYAAFNLYSGTVEVTGGSFTGTDFSDGYFSGTPYGEWTVDINEGATLTLKGGEFPNGFVVANTTANAFLAEDYYYKDADGKLITVSDDAKVIDGYVKVSKGADLADAVITLDSTEFTYNGSEIKPTVIVTVGGKTLTEGKDYTLTFANNVNVGTATVTVTAVADSIYSGEGTAYFTIEKADNSVAAAPVPNTFTYNGEAHNLISAGEAMYGTMVYSLDGAEYSETIPQGTNAGYYTVYYKVIGDANHADTEPETVTVTIDKKAVTVSATVPDRIYGDDYRVDTSKVVITFDGIVEGDDVGYVVTDATYYMHTVTDNAPVQVVYNVNGADAGNYQFPEFGDWLAPNYGVQATGRVLPRDISDAVIVLGDALVYNGAEQTQTVAAVTVDGLEVTYTVSGNKATNVGVYELTITGNGNFTGTKTALYEIAPDTTGIDALTVDNVKSSDKEAIEAVAQQIENAVTDLADDEKKAEYKAITDKCDKLLSKINDTANEIERIDKAVNGYDKETVTSDDNPELGKLIDDIKALTDGDNLTEDEKTALEETEKATDELVEKLAEVAEEINRADEAVKSYDEETVKSTDKDDLTQLKEDIQNLIDSTNTTESEKTALEDMIKDIEGLEDKIAETEQQLEDIKDIENNFNPETVSSDDKAAIEDAIAEVEAVNPDNLTDEQKAEYEEIKAGFEALLEEIAAAEKNVADIGAQLEMFDEERVTIFWEDDIEALKAKIDELLADENMGETEKAKLNEYKAQAEKLTEIINTPKEYFSLRFFYLIWDCLTWKYNGILWLFSKIFG